MRFQPKHGMHGSPEYRSWLAMKKRCLYKKHPHYADYGGAGITIDERWVGSFETFFEDMGKKPTPTHTLDRIDGNRGYSKSNCRWATYAEQAVNRRDNVRYAHNGQALTLREWARELNTYHGTLWRRLKNGWSVEKALSIPIKTYATR